MLLELRRPGDGAADEWRPAHCKGLAVRLVFDRGTILVREPPPGFDLSAFPSALWDARVGAYRAPAFRAHALRAWLARHGVPFADDEIPCATALPDVWTMPERRPYQEAALCAWELAGRRGVVVLPTGSGKTRVALAAMARTRLPTLCLVPTRSLLGQWERAIADTYAHPIGCFGDGRRELRPITLATFESAYRWMGRLGHRFHLLVVDEVHHFGCNLRDEALEMSIAGARLGLTATPPSDPAAIACLDQLVGPVVYELTIGDLAGRFLSDFDVITLRLELTPRERVAYERDMALFRPVYAAFRRRIPPTAGADFTRFARQTDAGRQALEAMRRVQRLLALTEAKRQIVGVLVRRHAAARVLVFTADNASAYAIAKEHLVMPLTCDIGRREREEALGRFQTGDLRALVSARVLNEGVDVPEADVAVVVGGSLGRREHVQRVGRLLRPREGKRALVYELLTARTLEVRWAAHRRAGLGARSAADG
jgi:superfamily II DNA or RNA helicase